MKIEVSMLRTAACHQHDEAGAGLGTDTAGCWVGLLGVKEAETFTNTQMLDSSSGLTLNLVCRSLLFNLHFYHSLYPELLPR